MSSAMWATLYYHMGQGVLLGCISRVAGYSMSSGWGVFRSFLGK